MTELPIIAALKMIHSDVRRSTAIRSDSVFFLLKIFEKPAPALALSNPLRLESRICIFCIMNIIICHVLFDSALNKRGACWPAGSSHHHHRRWFSPAVRWRCLSLSLSLSRPGIVVLCLLRSAVETTGMSEGRSEVRAALSLSLREDRSWSALLLENAGCRPTVKP